MKKPLAVIAVGLSVATGVASIGTQVDAGDLSVKGCVAAPLDGGTDCRRSAPDARLKRLVNARYFGAGNSFPAREAVGKCEPMPADSCSGGQ